MMSVNDNTDKAVSLLREAANLLAGGRETADGNQDTTSSTTGRSPTSTVVTNSVSNHDQNRVVQNFRSLFAGYRSTNPGTSTYPKRSETKSLPPAKRSRPSGSGYYRVRETWTREFLCMANKDVEAVTTKEDKLTLLAAGYTVPFLRDGAGLGQAIIYVRPIQQNLDMSEVKQEVGEESNTLALVSCLGCGKSVPMSSLREHHEKCSEERSQVSVSRISIDVDSDEYPDVPLPTKRLPTQEDEDKLCEVFPSKKETVRAALVAVDGDLERAAAMLAEESGNCVDDDKDDLLNKPVFEVPVVSDESY
ncbi:hypothetical protein ACROYT_G030651 [Oculina patagonica]